MWLLAISSSHRDMTKQKKENGRKRQTERKEFMVETEKTRERKQDKTLGGIGIERKRKGERE